MARLLTLGFVILALLLVPGPAYSVEPNIIVIRVDSIDDLVNDIERVARILGHEIDATQTLSGLAQTLRLPALDQIDRSRPVVLVVPTQGISLGLNGIVAALPAAAPRELARALAPDQAAHEQGLWIREREDGVDVARAADGYLILGRDKNLVQAFDLSAALREGNVPPGSVSAEIFLEPLDPLIRMGLQAARQLVAQQVAAGQDGADGPPEPAAMDPAALQRFLELYIGLLEDLLNNARQVQVSLELAGEDLVFHSRLLPKAGSTLEGLVHAQSGELPELVHRLDAEDPTMLMAGQITYTPEFLAAWQEFAQEYVDAMQVVFSSAGETEDSPVAWMQGALEVLPELVDLHAECYRGDFAAALTLDPEHGLRGTQFLGSADPERCHGLVMQTLHRLAERGAPLRIGDATRWSYGGVTATRQVMKIDLGEHEAVQDAQRLIDHWLGREGLVLLTAPLDDVVVASFGSQAERAFRQLVDRVGEGRAREGGSSRFAPLAEGPGYFARIDLGGLIESIASAVTEDPQLDRMRELSGRLPAPARRFVYGMRFDESGVSFEFALPLGLFGMLAEFAREQADDVPGPDEPQALGVGAVLADPQLAAPARTPE